MVVAQVRAATGQTLYHTDLVGEFADDTDRPYIAAAAQTAQIQKGEITPANYPDPVNMTAIPVLREGKIIAVLTREVSTVSGRRPGQLERTYLALFDDFATMIATGLFPFPGRVADSGLAPRVGDGAIVLDASARVRYASPNAVSALHRIGIRTNAVGQSLAELGFAHDAARASFERREPVVEELDQEHDVTLLVRSMPLLKRGARGVNVTGGVVLMRDVSELRRRDRLILTKDATIKEIHHRVKNNLQTVSALLRLQSRRVEDPAAQSALDEAVRRVASIAIVHETLAISSAESVDFDQVFDRIVQNAIEISSRNIELKKDGEFGIFDNQKATPLALIITELIHNALEHGLEKSGSKLTIAIEKSAKQTIIKVIDDGVGLPEGFNIDSSSNLGLQIVKTLTENELKGSINISSGSGETEAILKF